MTATLAAHLSPPEAADATAQLLVETAARGLARMFDPASGLFCYALRQGQQGLRREGASLRYTLIACLGLRRLEEAGGRPPVEPAGVLGGLLAQPERIEGAGNLGLLLWAAGPRLWHWGSGVLGREDALEAFPDWRAAKTRELAWLLDGLTECGAPEGLGRRVLERLLGNFVAATGLFRHQASGGLRGRVANFDDQVYPVHALARFARAYGAPEALEAALACAATLCRLQGPLGQWWWHFDAASGRVLATYPVFSVHQDAQAPMALGALSEASGRDFGPFVLKGLGWVAGANELGRCLVEAAHGVIWQGVGHRRGHVQRLEEALSFLFGRRLTPGRLVLTQECRSYHLGWVLYAWAARGSFAPEAAVGMGQ